MTQALIVVVAASSIAFVLLHVAPGDPYTTLGGGKGSTPQIREVLRRQYGLDQPLSVQYVRWISQTVRGNFGWSSSQEQPVSTVLMKTIPNTVLLMGLALVASIAFGIALGAWQGANAGSRGDRLLSGAMLTAYSIPQFLLGIALLFLFAQRFKLLPAGSMVDSMHFYKPFGERVLDRISHLVLPWLALTIVGTAVFARFQRAAMRDGMSEPFVRTARAKGLSEPAVRQHALRASLLPVITLAGLMFPALLGGAVVLEFVFSWPGMGSLVYTAINDRDYLLMAAVVVVGSAMTMLGTLLAEVTRAVADPRVAHS